MFIQIGLMTMIMRLKMYSHTTVGGTQIELNK